MKYTEPELAPLQIAKHVSLFLLTMVSTMIAGAFWQMDLDLAHLVKGLPYSISLLFILSCHEFGHYFAARYHRVRVTLPYYIPLPPFLDVSFGTLGAVIRTKEPIPHRRALFDIGIAGPIAGFVASIVVLAIGFATLPGKDFILTMHPDFDFAINTVRGIPPGETLTFGAPLLYQAMSALFSPEGAWIPPMWEMYHYPFLITGWFGLFVTALNVLPAGQLDGGHVLYAVSGKWHAVIARITVWVLLVLGVMSVSPLLISTLASEETAFAFVEKFSNYSSLFWPGWLMWVLILLFVIKIDHPYVDDYMDLGRARTILGLFAVLMFLSSIVPSPVYFQ